MNFLYSLSPDVVSTTRYVYDGIQVVQERDGENQPTVTYTRGLDLSGSLGGAGGIGGLLARTAHDPSGSDSHAYHHSDLGGNITGLMNENGYLVARYIYDAFGNTILGRVRWPRRTGIAFPARKWIRSAGCITTGSAITIRAFSAGSIRIHWANSLTRICIDLFITRR